jgi:desulfoferrodoxin (superoxide reductase-like protein)
MRVKDYASMGTLLLVLICLSSIPLVFADVPSVLEITREEEGGDTFLVMDVRHGSPSSSHYVDVIEVEIDGKVEKLADLDPQTSTRFEERLAADPEASIRVRAHCNVHGWSPWLSEGEEETHERRGIPGFPYGSVAIGVVSGLLALSWMRRRH